MIPILISAAAKVGMINAPTDNSASLQDAIFIHNSPYHQEKCNFMIEGYKRPFSS